MPELPEVETVKRTLAPRIEGLKIKKCSVYYEGSIKTHSSDTFRKEIEGAVIKKIERRGKFLKFFLNTGKILLIHLRMTGNLILATEDDPVTKHTHIIFYLDGGLQLRFIDIRKFGTIYLLLPEELDRVHGYAILGPEPLGSDFTLEYFKEKVKKRDKNIKTLLLDQDVVAGIGNIYADEILHAARINPSRRARSLNDDELKKLYDSIKKELTKGIANKGTSFRNYVDGEGSRGNNQDFLHVYKKEGTNCSRCGTTIVREKLGGRGCRYCPGCQK